MNIIWKQCANCYPDQQPQSTSCIYPFLQHDQNSPLDRNRKLYWRRFTISIVKVCAKQRSHSISFGNFHREYCRLFSHRVDFRPFGTGEYCRYWPEDVPHCGFLRWFHHIFNLCQRKPFFASRWQYFSVCHLLGSQCFPGNPGNLFG